MDHTSYLDALGITEYQLRDQLQFCNLLNAENYTVATLVLPHITFEPNIQADVDTLLDAIFKVIKWHRDSQVTLDMANNFLQQLTPQTAFCHELASVKSSMA